MSELRNIALTVHELEAGEFYWVLLEGAEDDSAPPDLLPFVPLEVAEDPQPTYANALVAGVAALRKIFGKEGPRA
ncbi:MAG: hypothetical protein KKC79_04530 [Gammaproteobacteria bacterium]|nr:hypothetical protein [Gammaproteobacteria bacterium]MBU1441888.1 hypothetical protein [Gammaproteobacteria bacterium]MBU2407899.1 hypothetical protein [Gammaproteobacteria bacterium]